jgi:hypothetical protein
MRARRRDAFGFGRNSAPLRVLGGNFATSAEMAFDFRPALIVLALSPVYCFEAHKRAGATPFSAHLKKK